MVLQINSISDAEIARAVDQGLSRQHKSLPNWMLYDEAVRTGDTHESQRRLIPVF
jgi:hypothetical protein